MRLSTLPMLLGLATGTMTGSAQSTQVTKNTLIQTIQTTGETNLDRSEAEKQAIIDSLQKVYGPFLVYDSSNPDDVKKLEKMEKEAAKKRSEAHQNDDAWRDKMLGDDISEAEKTRIKKRWKDGGGPPPPPGNMVRTLDLHEADKYARDTGAHIAFQDLRGTNEIVTYKKLTHPIDLSVLGVNYGMDDIIIGSHGLEIMLRDTSGKQTDLVRGMNQRIEEYISTPTDTFFSTYITREQATYYLKNSDFLEFLSVILQKPITEITPRNIYMLIFNGFSHKNIEDSRRK